MADDAKDSALGRQVAHLTRALAWERIQKDRLLDALDLLRRDLRLLRTPSAVPYYSETFVEFLRQESQQLREQVADLTRQLAARQQHPPPV